MFRIRTAGCCFVLVGALASGCVDFAVSDEDAPGGAEAEADAGGSEAVDGGDGESGVVEVMWTWTGGEYWNVDQAIRLEQPGAPAHWGQHFNWSDEPDVEGGWVAIETDIDRIDGSHGDTAVFLLRDALGATGPSCAAQGSDWRCEVAIDLDPDTTYRLRIWTLGKDETRHTWGAWFMNHATAETDEVEIGRIDAKPSRDLMHAPRDRIALLATEADCAHTPMALGYLMNAAANQVSPGEYEHLSIYKGDVAASGCTGAVVQETDGESGPGVVVSYGVP